MIINLKLPLHAIINFYNTKDNMIFTVFYLRIYNFVGLDKSYYGLFLETKFK